MTAAEAMPKLEVVYRNVDDLIPYARNSRTHSEAQINQLAGSIREFGFNAPVLLDGNNGLIAGHGRVEAARKAGLREIPTIDLCHLSPAQRRAYVIADNKLALNAGWDFEMLSVELDDLLADGFDIDILGFTQQEIDELIGNPDAGGSGLEGDEGEGGAGSLSDKFMIAPFSVLNAREGWWQERKRAWLAMGIKSEVGRAENLLNMSETVLQPDPKKRAEGIQAESSGTSIFDPVLCEIAYRWFSPPDGVVLDPFAGGSVRGVVAAKLGRQYVGHELRAEQVEANFEQAREICQDLQAQPVWICGDSRNIDKTCHDIAADLVFSCPPYADLEVYSDDPKDISTMDYPAFIEAYREIIAKACARLKKNRFAVWVIGEIRDKKTGAYRDFVGDTVQAFRDAGLQYYNEAILVTAVGTLPIRAGRTFASGRKLGKTHQNVLVFVKGDGFKASQACGDVEVSDECFAQFEEAQQPEVEQL